MPNTAPPDPSSELKAAAGRRLRRARYALNYPNQAVFAEITGVTQANLSNWERGISLVPPDYGRKLKRLFQVTTDWLYAGDASGLREDLRKIILEEGLDIPDTDE